MHNHDDKYPARPGFEPGTSTLQAPVDTNEPSGPAQIIVNVPCAREMHITIFCGSNLAYTFKEIVFILI